MPSLPRIRTRRVGQPVRAEVARGSRGSLSSKSDGLTWIHLEAPTHEEVQQLAKRFGWHPLDIEDVLSRRQRPKVDVYTERSRTATSSPSSTSPSTTRTSDG